MVGCTAKLQSFDEKRAKKRSPVVEVTADETGLVVIEMDELGRARQQTHLLASLACRQSKMEIEDLQPVRVTGSDLQPESRVLASTSLFLPDRQVDISLAQNRIATERRVAVSPLTQAHVMTDGEVWILRLRRQLESKVHLPRTGYSFVHFLE